ncbi:hypothetical protein Hdeb2414_s0001g00028331 [Helianthus debilis subsp. tardiflorus]
MAHITYVLVERIQMKIRIFFALVEIRMMIYASLFEITVCGYIVIDIELVIKKYTYDEYIWAAVALYVDILHLFLQFLRILGERRR